MADLKSGNDSFSAAFIIHSLFKVSLMLFRSLSNEDLRVCLPSLSHSLPVKQELRFKCSSNYSWDLLFIHYANFFLPSLDGQFMCSSRRQQKKVHAEWFPSEEVSPVVTRSSYIFHSHSTAEKKHKATQTNSESGQSLKVQEFNCLYYSSPS